MKKTLLLFSLLIASLASAQQVFWEEKSTGFPNVSTSMGQISYADANTVWIYATAGDGSGDFYTQWGRSLDAGETWANGNINLPSSSLAIGSVHGMSASKAYVSVFPNAAGVFGGVFVSTDSGLTWTKQTTASYNTGTDSFTNIVHFWGTDTGVTMGDPAGGYFEIYTTTNGGTNWTRVPSANIPAPLSGEYGYTHNYEVSGNTIWYGTNKGRIYKSTNQGLNWTVAQSPIGDFGSATISGNFTMKDQNEGLLIASDFQFFRTTDGGSTWTAESPSGIYRNFDVTYVPGTSNTYVCTGEDPLDGARGSSYSTDGGLNWTDINEIDVDPVDGGGALAFYDPTHGLASGFTTSSTVGGIWKWINDALELENLANNSFATTKFHTLSPNPTSGLVTISGKGISNVVITDVLGKQVANTNFTSVENATIDMTSYNAGIYMVKITNADGNASTIKVVRQ